MLGEESDSDAKKLQKPEILIQIPPEESDSHAKKIPKLELKVLTRELEPEVDSLPEVVPMFLIPPEPEKHDTEQPSELVAAEKEQL